jgi:Tol biopolymer transport system component
MGINGKDLKQLTSDSKPKFDLQWLANEQVLVYMQEQCVFQLEVATRKITKITCFNAKFFNGFRVSPDGKQVAISIERQLFIVPFDVTLLATVHDRNAVVAINGCLAYQAVSVKNSLWSKDGQKLAILFLMGGNDRRVAETVRVMDVHNCRESDPLILDEFPGKHFTPESYKINQVLPSFSWDGNELFILNSLKRNDGYGPLYTYDMSSQQENKLTPVGACCYRDARFSPDGHFVLFVFQDFSLGADSKTLLYYIPIESIGSTTTFAPVPLPDALFADPRANPQFALHFAPAAP